jgi:hypothetical protein
MKLENSVVPTRRNHVCFAIKKTHACGLEPPYLIPNDPNVRKRAVRFGDKFFRNL